MTQRDPELIIKRIIVGVFGLLAVGGGAVAATACVRAFAVHGDSPLMLIGILGGLAALAAGVYYVYLALNPRRRFARR